MPILIDLLGNSDVTVRSARREARYTLTHCPDGEDAASERQHGIRWWALQRMTAQFLVLRNAPDWLFLLLRSLQLLPE